MKELEASMAEEQLQVEKIRGLIIDSEKLSDQG